MAQVVRIENILAEFRSLVVKGEATKTKRMFLLVETKPFTAIWQSGPYMSWGAFLRGECLCSEAYYNAFETATRLFDRKLIECIGSDAATVLAKVEEPLRAATLKKIEAHMEAFTTPPSNRMIWSYVHTLRMTPMPMVRKIQQQSRARH